MAGYVYIGKFNCKAGLSSWYSPLIGPAAFSCTRAAFGTRALSRTTDSGTLILHELFPRNAHFERTRLEAEFFHWLRRFPSDPCDPSLVATRSANRDRPACFIANVAIKVAASPPTVHRAHAAPLVPLLSVISQPASSSSLRKTTLSLSLFFCPLVCLH